METLTKYPNRLPDGDKKFFTFFPMEDILHDEKIQCAPERFREKITIFLVDDDPIYLMALEHYLMMELPYLKIKAFKTGEESLQKLNESPDIVILDYFLNSENYFAEDGIHILKKIKDKRPDTKVIMLSCQEKINVERDSIKHGALEYIPKCGSAFVMIKHLIRNLTGDDKFWID